MLTLNPIRSLRLLVFFALTSQLLGQTGAITWGTSKSLEIDFGDEFVRVGSDFASFSFATGFGTDVAFPVTAPELHPIATSSESSVAPTAASTFDAVSSAVAQWHIFKDNFSGVADLTNAVAGTASIALDGPDLVAVSWATQASSVDLGVPDHTGAISWTPTAALGTGGGGLANSSGTYKITDPIVVWTQDATGVAEPHTIFQFTAEGDDRTNLAWNELAQVDSNTGEVSFLANDGPFLDATDGGSGSFSLALGSDLLPLGEHGTIDLAFEDGIVTAASATGIFLELAPRQGGVGTLPMLGEPALIDSLSISNSTSEQFVTQLNTGQQQPVSDIAACSEGYHVQLGAAVDSVQTFSIDPTNREPLASDTTMPTPADRVPRPCFGSLSDATELLFGNVPSADHELVLVAATDAPTIDRFARLELDEQENHKTLALDRGPQSDLPQANDAPNETRSWKATVDVRDLDVQNSGTQIFAVSLVDVASHGETSEPGFTLFSGETQGITFAVGQADGVASVQLFLDGERVEEADADIAADILSDIDWNTLELSVEEQHDSTRFRLDVAGSSNTTIVDTTIDAFELAADGYRLAVGSRTINTAGGHDFDNLILSYQQNGDVVWDGQVDGTDVTSVAAAVQNGLTDAVFDTNADGNVDELDIEVVEDLVPNRLPGDANFDGTVDFPDFLALSEAFGETTGLWSRGDFDGNGEVNFPDFLILSQNFGTTQVAASVPEPNLNCWYFLALLCLLRRSQRRARG